MEPKYIHTISNLVPAQRPSERCQVNTKSTWYPIIGADKEYKLKLFQILLEMYLLPLIFLVKKYIKH